MYAIIKKDRTVVNISKAFVEVEWLETIKLKDFWVEDRIMLNFWAKISEEWTVIKESLKTITILDENNKELNLSLDDFLNMHNSLNSKVREEKVMLYLVDKVNKEFHVLEKSSGLNVFVTTSAKEAERMKVLLNSGSCFDGHIPGFFVKESAQ